MAWKKFPYPSARFRYTAEGLKAAWRDLHAGDAEPWPRSAHAVDAWIAFHAGDFELAEHDGMAAGHSGEAAANKASCVHAVYIEPEQAVKCARLQAVAERCERQQARQPDNAAGFYWHAYALGRYAQEISVIEALAQGIGGKVKASLEKTLALAPRHADALIAMGVYHAEIIDKTGSLIGRLTYGANRDDAIACFKAGLALNPDSIIARLEYARGLLMLDGRAARDEAEGLRRAAAGATPRDAMERLDLERARQEHGGS
jgi:tetratricopeptide (TPR) repeat protein